MNVCNFVGNLVREPELRETQSGKKVINFTIAVNRTYKKGDERVSEAAFLDLEAWDTGAETIAKYFSKGEPIMLRASAKTDQWEDADGEKRSRTKFRVEQFWFVPGYKYAAQNKDGAADEAPKEEKRGRGRPKKDEASAPAGATSGDSDIPF